MTSFLADVLTAMEVVSAKDARQYGKKGMKWGVRNDRGHEGEQVKTKKLAKLDKKYDQSFTGMAGYGKVSIGIESRFGPRLEDLNAKPEYATVNLTHPSNRSTYDRYLGEYKAALQKASDDTMSEFGTNASGTKQLQITAKQDGDDIWWEAEIKAVKHADDEEPFIKITPTFDAGGRVTGQKFEVLDRHLAHYGRKGMKWGVTTLSDGTTVKTAAVPGKKVKTEGGKGAKPSEDAIKARVGRQVAKSSSTDALSNQELQAVVTRMQLEANYKRLTAEDKTAGQKFISRFFLNQKQREKDLENIESLYGTGATVVTAARVGQDIKKMKL